MPKMGIAKRGNAKKSKAYQVREIKIIQDRALLRENRKMKRNQSKKGK